MPQAIPLAVQAIASAAGATALQAAAAAAVASLVVGAHQAKRARRKARDAFNASLQDRLVAQTNTDVVRSRCYGRVRNADAVLFKGSHGANRSLYTFVVACAGHEIDAVEDVYFADDLVTLGAADGSGWQSVTSAPYLKTDSPSLIASCTVTAGSGMVTLPDTPLPGSVSAVIRIGAGDSVQEFSHTPSVVGADVTFTAAPADGDWTVSYQTARSASKARVRKCLGAAGQDLSTLLSASFPTEITAAHKFEGVAGLIVELTFDPDVFPSGVPAISAVFRGAKVLDPRSGLTAWTENPALITRDWALYEYGGRATSAELDEDALVVAANACDVTHGFVTPSGTNTLPVYTCGIVCKTDADPTETLNAIVESMAGKWGWAGGQLRVRAGAYTAPVTTITDTWLRGAEQPSELGAGGSASLQVVTAASRQELVNVVRPTISDAAQAYVATPIPEIRVSSYITADGGEYVREEQYEGVTDAVHAQHVAGVRMREARNGLTCVLPCNMKAYVLELFDVVEVTLSRLGWEAKLFEVIGWQWSLLGGITLTLKETAAAIFDPDASFEETDLTPNTSLPDPFDVPAPAGLALASGTAQLLRQADGTIVSRILATWTAVASEAVQSNGKVIVSYGRATTDPDTWAEIEVPGDATQVYLENVLDGAFYLVRVRSRSSRLIRGDWSLPVLHKVAGKTALPANVANFTATQVPGGVLFSWDKNTEVDYLDTELHIEAVWADGTAPLFRGAADSYVWPWPAAGTYTVLAKHRDTSRLLSTTAASETFDVDADGLISTVELQDEAATEVSSGALDTATYNGSFGGTHPGDHTVVAPATCRMIVTVTAELTATNSSGSAKNIWAIYQVEALGVSGGGSSASRLHKRSIANGESWGVTVVDSFECAVDEGVSYGCGLYYSDHASATQTTTLTNIQTRVEFIKR